MKKFILIAALIHLTIFLFSQNPTTTNTLLWRISGKGLKKPSYLYGTMHLTDKRVFQLGDSVYAALEQTQGFAAELDMNSVGTQMINQFLKEREEKRAKEPEKVKQKINTEMWNMYKDRLEKKLNKKADEITVEDLDNIETRLQSDLFKNGEMSTFLDAWLSGQAKKQGKWIGGIEDLEDQFEEINNDEVEEKIQKALYDDNYYRSSLDWFIKIYTDQKLDTIDAYMYRENGKKDPIIIKRNLKMARRIDSLASIRNTLFAIGAAHLPGDSGVIAMLRNRGFTVTPVISSKKISADKYVSKKVESAWFPVAIKDSSYGLEMPGVAENLAAFESLDLSLKTFFDISFMKLYMTIGIDMPEDRRKLGIDSIFKSMGNYYSKNGKVLKEKKILVNGTEGREYTIDTYEGVMKMQIFLPQMEKIILNAVYSFTEKSLNEPETEKFFQSFVYNSNFHAAEKKETVWTLMEFPQQSFSVEMPIKPKGTKDVISEKGIITYSWQGVDVNDQIFYGMSVSAMKEGMYNSKTDTSALLAIKENLKHAFEDAVVIDSSFISFNGYPGFSLSMDGKSGGESLETKIIYIIRGGLTYYLFAVYHPNGTGTQHASRFLNSFRLMPYKQPQWKQVVSPDRSFSTSSPFSLLPKENLENDIHPGAERFIMYDSMAAVTGYIDKTIFPEWLWYKSDTSFLRKRADHYRSWSDSIIGYTVDTTGSTIIADFIVQDQGDPLVKKVKLVLNGNELYEMFGHFAQNDLTAIYNKFFDDFKVLNPKNRVDRSLSKIEKLRSAFKNNDKKTAKEIDQWWEYLSFTEEDVPFLQSILLKVYPDFDTTSYIKGLNKTLFDEVNYLDSNHTTVEFIKRNYGSIQHDDEYIKPFVISYLSHIKTSRSYSVLKDCMTNYPFKIEKDLYFSTGFYDSLKLTATLFPEAMKLGSSMAVWDNISRLACSLLDSGLLAKKSIKEYGKYFIETANRELAKDKQTIENTAYSYSSLIKILGIINTPEANAVLNRFAKFDSREIKFRTTIALLENNQQVDNRNFLTFALTDEYRHDLYDELKRLNKLNLFPASFLSQKELGKSKLFLYGDNGDDVPQAILYLGDRTISYKGKQEKFYLYKVSYSGDMNYYLGVAGPYSLNPKDMISSHEATGVFQEKVFEPNDIDEQFRSYLKSLEED